MLYAFAHVTESATESANSLGLKFHTSLQHSCIADISVIIKQTTTTQCDAPEVQIYLIVVGAEMEICMMQVTAIRMQRSMNTA